jgi:glycerophosphoryl diester phosphodiesterase
LGLLASVCIAGACAGGTEVQDGPLHHRDAKVGLAGGGSRDPDGGDALPDPRGDPQQRSYWKGTARKLALSPAGNVVGVSCHNCYRFDLATSGENLAATLAKLHAAQQAGADLLELDVKEQAGTWYVGHDDDGSSNGATFDDVLADDALLHGDQVLYIEIKEQDPNENRMLELLTSIAAAGYAVEGRDVVIRTFNALVEHLNIAARLLGEGELADNGAHFRLQVLYTLAEADDATSIEMLIDGAASSGLSGVEFNYTSARVLDLLDLARGLGLGTNVWTFGVDDGTAKCAEFRDVTDAVTTDSPLDLCRAAVEGR